MQDYQLLEKLAHQNRERIPERVVHAKGWGAYGTFTVTHDITKYTKAKIFSEVGKKTEMLARFSTVAGEAGAADAERDVRGFALKFYTEEGNWDLVGNNTPVFFVRDPYKFPDFIHTQKRHPEDQPALARPRCGTSGRCRPESLHQVTILMSDRGLPIGVRHMNGYGSHTYSFINAKNERFWVKFHFKTLQGHKHWTNAEAAEVVGRTRESTQEDLFDAIERGDFPKWRFSVQVMPETDAEKTPYNPFDLTKVWPHGDYPLIEVGDHGAEPQSRQLLRRGRAGRLLALEHRAGHRLLAGQDAAGADLLLRRRASLPPRHPLRGAARQRAEVPGASLPQGRADALLPATTRNPDAYYEPNSFNGPVERPEVRRAAAEDLAAMPTATTTARATTTTASPARCSTCSTTARRRGSSPTSPRRCRACRRTSSSASSGISRRCIPTTPRVSGRRWPNVQNRGWKSEPPVDRPVSSNS